MTNKFPIDKNHQATPEEAQAISKYLNIPITNRQAISEFVAFAESNNKTVFEMIEADRSIRNQVDSIRELGSKDSLGSYAENLSDLESEKDSSLQAAEVVARLKAEQIKDFHRRVNQRTEEILRQECPHLFVKRDHLKEVQEWAKSFCERSGYKLPPAILGLPEGGSPDQKQLRPAESPTDS
ncbi:hypothetical protein K9N68_37430 (plasmid) [Kovacikia minuta CCNUW1]|uniref:hypothetical protein n=1 Tax=Kovacikia minuta TaxID=2931930 RepID=UPI001CCBCDEE|nr:hypothetical protein [Kovacikia minuta]UBF29896.1 hypothetical protein K9N68_37430 [Kovacikia minuta CCNUW1]